MSVMSRRQLMHRTATAALMVGMPAAITKARAAEFTFKLGNTQPASHPTNIQLGEAAKRITEQTSGRFVLEIYPHSQLGADSDMVSQTRMGAIEMLMTGAPQLAPQAAITALPFVFDDYAQAFASLDTGPLGDSVRGLLRSAGVIAMRKPWNVGLYHYFTRDRAINVPADMKGLKLRTPAIPVHITGTAALGAAPAGIPGAETYTALQTKLIDGASSSLQTSYTAKHHEVTKYLALTGHLWEGLWLMANPVAWNGLPGNIREIVEANLNDAALRQRQDIEVNDTKILADLSKTLTITKPDKAQFREVILKSGFYKSWKEKLNPDLWQKLETSTGKKLDV